jgi:hypothetical protein
MGSVLFQERPDPADAFTALGLYTLIFINGFDRSRTRVDGLAEVALRKLVTGAKTAPAM